MLFLLFWQASKACVYSCVSFPMLFAFMLLSSFVSPAQLMTSTFNARHYSQKYFINITLLRSFGRTIPIPFTYSLFLFLLSLPVHSISVCLFWKLLPWDHIRNTKRRWTSAWLLTFATSNLVKQSQEAPWVRPELIQTPLCCVNAILGTGLYPTAAPYLGLTSHSKLYSSPLSLLSRENWLHSLN